MRVLSSSSGDNKDSFEGQYLRHHYVLLLINMLLSTHVQVIFFFFLGPYLYLKPLSVIHVA